MNQDSAKHNYSKPLPHRDRDSVPFWEGLEDGEFRAQQCKECKTLRWPARAICNRCHSFNHKWIALSGKGQISSWITNHQIFMAAYKDDTPYQVLRIELEEQQDLQIIGQFDGDYEPQNNMPVEMVIRQVTADTKLVFWKPCLSEK